MPAPPKPKLNLMVASTVYHFEDHLRQICGVLTGFGYEVWNSHIGTIRVHPMRSNEENCIAAARECDAFLGIIRPFYGSGIIGPRSITHGECLEAIRRKKPRWFLVHRDVTFARHLLKPYLYNADGSRAAFEFKKTSVMDDVRAIELYDDSIQSAVPPADRKGHWAQEFYRVEEAFDYINFQFKDAERVRGICEDMAKP
jgi:hypothetical protein